MTEKSGQISAEYLFITGILILIAMISAVLIYDQQELNTAMSAAKIGVNDGIAVSSSGIYPKQTYNEYSKSKSNLLLPYSIEIVNISYSEIGFDNNYDKKRIQFKVYAKSSKELSKKQLDSIGERINYNLRKSIAISFNSTSATNKLYNPVFSHHYVFTTANVKWV